MNNENSKKEKKIFLTNDLTRRGLSLLLVFSFIATIIAFAVAYCEHKNYSTLITKYDESLRRIESCEASISALMTTQPDYSYTTEYIETTKADHLPSEENKSSDNQDYITAQQTSDKETETTQKAETSSGYYVTQSGKKYHIASCSYLSKSRVPVSLERIKAEGYSPCSRCIK